MIYLLIASAQAAPCSGWNAGLHTADTSGAESKAITATWSAAGPVACGNSSGDQWDGTHSLRVVRKAGGTPPSSPTDGTLVGTLAPSATTVDDYVHRSSKLFAHRVFACENAGCTSWCGDGSGNLESATSTGDSETTAQERWVLDGVTGETDVSSAAVDDKDANAPHAFFYPSDWATGYSGKLALYYSKADAGAAPSQVYWKLHDASGWPAAGFNDTASWDSPVLVAEGSVDSADDDYNADHPWAMLTRDGSNKRVQLFVQSQDLSNNKVIQIESTDEAGDDFGLGCGASCAASPLSGDGYLAIDADGTSATQYVAHARHSRIGWDYIADPYIDAGTDLPFMMFQLERPGSGSCADTGPDDIGWADGAWDGVNSVWAWEVETDGGSPDCPVAHIDDAHDNSMIPLPGGEFKAYYKEYGTDDWFVTYWDGSSWGDDALIAFAWDGAGGPTSDCVENISSFVYMDGGNPREGMFFMLLDSDLCTTGFDDESPGTDNADMAIVFAELAN